MWHVTHPIVIVIVIVITNQDSTSSRLLPGSSYSCCIRNLHAQWLLAELATKQPARRPHAPGSERHTQSLVHPHAQVTELLDIGHGVIAKLYRAPQSALSCHQNCTLADADSQALGIGIPQETVHLISKTCS
jgi:hypothetical protein